MDFYFDPMDPSSTPRRPDKRVLTHKVQYDRSLINLLAYSEEINQSAILDDVSFGPGMAIVDSSDVIETDAELVAAFGPSREPSHSIDESSDSEKEEGM
jgi:hypothetical protein